jgi:glycine/D-amino acid oxidase-like deaminating enzyme
VRVGVKGNLGALYSPHCAALHPARLARGLASSVEQRGVAIYERSPALSIEHGVVTTPGGQLRADLVLLATEAYGRDLPGRRRRLVPIHSMMIATEPLPDEVWKQIGLAQRETFGDPRRMVIYGQRTADGRIAFGSRGSYYFGSGIRNRFAPDDEAFEHIRRVLVSMFGVLAEARITHTWGGPLGVPRDWRVAIGVDREAGLGWAGGYVGEGVCASNLAARTLADLVLERDTATARLPWAGRDFSRWEPEPLRYAAVRGMTALGAALDRSELDGARPPRLRSALYRRTVRR